MPGAIPLIKEAAVDLSQVYGMWFEKTQVPPNTSVIIMDGTEAYAAYVQNSPATLLFEVPNAAVYAFLLIRALERTPYAFYINPTTAASVEEKAKKTLRLYDVEEVRRGVEALKRKAAARPGGEPAQAVEVHVVAPREPALRAEPPAQIVVEPPAEPPRGAALEVHPRPSASLRREPRVEASVDLCAQLDEKLREVGLSLAEFRRLLDDERFKAALKEILRMARA